MTLSINKHLSSDAIQTLVRRLELLPQLLVRQQEEEIIKLVPIESEWIEQERRKIFAEQDEAEFLKERGWTARDLELYLLRPEALRRFAHQRFGPGLEEKFLLSLGGRDEVIFSLLRVKDEGLARELWIRLEEGEMTFAEAAQQYSEGPECHRKGVMGPMKIGVLQPPQLAELIRTLKPGQISFRKNMGQWHVLIRLEQLTPARFDQEMREHLLQEELSNFLDDRVKRLLADEPVDDLHYD